MSQDQYITPIKFNIESNNSQSASLFSGSTQDTFFRSNSFTQIQISSFELETLGIKLGGTQQEMNMSDIE